MTADRPTTEPTDEERAHAFDWPNGCPTCKRAFGAEAAQGAAPSCPCDEYEPCAEHQSEGAAPLAAYEGYIDEIGDERQAAPRAEGLDAEERYINRDLKRLGMDPI